MADGIVGGLFGMQSPQQLQQEYYSGLMTPAAQMGQMNLLNQLIATAGNAGAMMGYGGGRLLGGKVAGEVEAASVNDALQQVNKMGIKDPAEKMSMLADLLSQNPATTKQAMMAKEEATRLKKQGYEMSSLERAQNLQKAVAAIPADATPESRSASIKDALRQFGSTEQQVALAKEDAAAAKEQEAVKNRATSLVSSFGTNIDAKTALSIASDKDLFNKVMEDRWKYREQKTKVITTKDGVQLVKDPSGETIKDYGPPPSGVTVINPGQKAEDVAYGQLVVEQYKDISAAAKNASKNVVAFETNLNILNKGFTTGFGTETKAAAASVLSALGVQGAEQFATDSQVFKAAASSAILQKQLEQKGPQTEPDARRIEQTSAQLGNTKEANTFLLKVGIAQAKRDIEQRKFYDKWKQVHKTFIGAEDAWYEGEGGKSLFERPELKEYAKGATAKADQIPGGEAAPTPIYAVNPQTKQRIVSMDGGKTWQEAR